MFFNPQTSKYYVAFAEADMVDALAAGTELDDVVREADGEGLVYEFVSEVTDIFPQGDTVTVETKLTRPKLLTSYEL